MSEQTAQKTGIVIQARLASTRLPGKVLRPFQDGRSILDILLHSLSQTKLPLVLATSTATADDPLAEYCKEHNIPCFRGSEQDVLDRFLQAADRMGFTHAVRVCADNPFFVADLIMPMITALEKVPSADYISFQNAEGIPAIRTHWGLLGELVKVSALRRATEMTQDAFYREHVTNYLYGHPEIFELTWLEAPAEIFARHDLRFTVDNQADFELAEELLDLLPTDWTLEDLIRIAAQEERYLQTMRTNIEKYSK